MTRAATILLALMVPLHSVTGQAAALRIDFTQTGGPVQAGFQPYYADHESASTFTEQFYSAFGSKIVLMPIWPNNPAPQALQMIERSSGSALAIDWIGTDARVAGADPLVLAIEGLPAGRYAWISYHHDTQDQTGLFDVTVTDATGSVTTRGVDISSGAVAFADMTIFEAVIESDGTSLITLSFENQGYTNVSEAFFVMNGFILEALDGEDDDPAPPEDPWTTSVVISEFVASNRASLLDGDGRASDWIELYNGSDRSVVLTGWHLIDSESNLRKWCFPPGVILPSGGYLVVFASGRPEDDCVDQAGHLHVNFALNKDGEYLALVDPEGAVVHEFAPSFPPQEADISYGVWEAEPSYFATPTPGRRNQRAFTGLIARTVHSASRGFYDQAFDLELFCETPETSIRYTLDGSEPTQQNGMLYDPQRPIRISTTTQVRSIAFRAGWMPRGVTTHTYIFVDHVARQPANPPGWPTDWGHDSEVGGIVPADYEMDPRVVDNTLPGYSVREALLDVPSVSISMEPDDFIGKAGGIYANPLSRWERKCSVEYILPDGAEGFQEDGKIEVHGNSSRRPWRMQKHSLRLTFTSEYGSPKLRYPLFPGSDVEEFNQLVLRASFTDSWALVSWVPSRYRPNDSQYLRDVWMKESQRAMGQPSGRGSFVHLYVDGLYFGLYNLAERVGEDFFAEHLGGRPEDWEVNDDLSAPGARWRAMMAVNPSTPAGYAQMQEYLDVENFADYVLLHLYADAEDWPHHNGYAAVNAVSGDGRFRFFVWDQEIVLDCHGRAASRIDSTGGAGDVFQKMRTSAEFRLLFADRVFKHCFHDGALSLAVSQARYYTVARWIDKAIVAESARWGDTQMSTPYGNTIQQPSPLTNINHDLYPPAPHGPDYYFTREDSWVVERDNIIHNYLPAIHNAANSYALLSVLRSKKLYPDIDPPEFLINGDLQRGGSIASGDVLTMTNPNGMGTIYYTLDGADPRKASASGPQRSVTLVAEDAPKAVWMPTGDIGVSWTGGAEPFDDSTWTDGTPAIAGASGGVGYERSTGYEAYIRYDVEAQMYARTAACYIRIPFAARASDLADFNYMTLRVRYDDGFVAYLNGTRIASANAGAPAAWNEGAAASHGDVSATLFEDFDCSAFVGLLRPGGNILAIHGMNAGATSSDFLISVELLAGAGADDYSPLLSPSARVYTEPVSLAARTPIKARLWRNGQWSALNEAVYTMGGSGNP